MLLQLLCIGIVDLTDNLHSMLELGSELSNELLPLSLLTLTGCPHRDLVSTGVSTLVPLLLLLAMALSLEQERCGTGGGWSVLLSLMLR